MPPPDAERVASRVCVYLVTLISVHVAILEQPGAQPERHFMSITRILNVKVEMHLLWSPVRPLRRNVVRRRLDTDTPLARGIDDGVNMSSPKTCPRNMPAQNLLSASRSAASNTTT